MQTFCEVLAMIRPVVALDECGSFTFGVYQTGDGGSSG